MNEKNCSNCKVGLLDKYVNIGSCPYFNPSDGKHCRMWKRLDEVKKVKKVNSDEEKLNTHDSIEIE